MSVFSAADLLIPKEEYLSRWAVVACDQYTSQPEYWQRVREYVGDAPSTLNLILPEAQLASAGPQTLEKIHSNMDACRGTDIFRVCPHSFVYVERTLADGGIRRGVVGLIDLEQYDYSDKSCAQIRATEKTVVERIPPRKAVRQGASLDMTHVILLSDDSEDRILGMLRDRRDCLPKVYDFDLMEQGGHIAGWLVQGKDAEALEEAIRFYEQSMAARGGAHSAMAYAVGDGNHSLASAKACYDSLRQEHTAQELENNPVRYALVELENIHHAEQEFEPIHRIVKLEDPRALLAALEQECGAAEGYPVNWYMGKETGCIHLDPKLGKSAIAILQGFLDRQLDDPASQLDYIHGEDVLRQLAAGENRLGLALPAISKNSFFEGLMVDGVLPRKTFSIGQAQEKRFYLETRVLR